MESSGQTASSAPRSAAVWARRAMRATLPAMSPTVVLICPRAMRMKFQFSDREFACGHGCGGACETGPEWEVCCIVFSGGFGDGRVLFRAANIRNEERNRFRVK